MSNIRQVAVFKVNHFDRINIKWRRLVSHKKIKMKYIISIIIEVYSKIYLNHNQHQHHHLQFKIQATYCLLRLQRSPTHLFLRLSMDLHAAVLYFHIFCQYYACHSFQSSFHCCLNNVSICYLNVYLSGLETVVYSEQQPRSQSPLKMPATDAGETSGSRSISRPQSLSPKGKHSNISADGESLNQYAHTMFYIVPLGSDLQRKFALWNSNYYYYILI